MVRYLIVVLCLVLVACGGSITPTASQDPNQTPVTEEPTAPPVTEEPTTPPVTEAPTEPTGEPTSWDNPYDPGTFDDPKAELLCPPDGAPDAQPVFGEVLTGKIEDQDVLIRHGLYVNAQNEIFRIDVIAPSSAPESADSLNQYTNEVIVCFDHILLTMVTEAREEPPAEVSMAEPFGSTSLADLAIEVYMQAYASPNIPREDVWEALKAIVQEPVETWLEGFKARDMLTPQDAYPEKVQQDFLLAYIFDPWVSAGARHQYGERSASRVFVTASVGGGSGSVTAGLCRNSESPFSSMTVTKGGAPETDSRSDWRLGNYRYDLGVRGGSGGGTYKISGAWGVAGWYADYWSSAPTGSWYGCNP